MGITAEHARRHVCPTARGEVIEFVRLPDVSNARAIETGPRARHAYREHHVTLREARVDRGLRRRARKCSRRPLRAA